MLHDQRVHHLLYFLLSCIWCFFILRSENEPFKLDNFTKIIRTNKTLIKVLLLGINQLLNPVILSSVRLLYLFCFHCASEVVHEHRRWHIRLCAVHILPSQLVQQLPWRPQIRRFSIVCFSGQVLVAERAGKFAEFGLRTLVLQCVFILG